jgi:predicted DNA-binding protein (UPF0251 family)
MSNKYKKNFDPTEWISQSEAARMRGISRQAIGIYVKRGRFTTFLMGGKTFLLRSEMENFEPQKRGPKPKRKKRATKK